MLARRRLEALQLLQGAEVRALGGVDAALHVVKIITGALEDLAERSFLVQTFIRVARIAELVVPELGFGTAEAAELPIGVDEGVDQKTLEGTNGLELAMVVGGESFQLTRIFAGNDLGRGVDASVQGRAGEVGIECRHVPALRIACEVRGSRRAGEVNG